MCADAESRRALTPSEIEQEMVRLDGASEDELQRIRRSRTPEEVDQEMGWLDGMLGAAGHSIDDPVVRALIRQQVAGELPGDEVRARIIAHVRDG